MTSPITFTDRCRIAWTVFVSQGTESGIWFNCMAGPANMGVTLSISQARAIAHALTVAADDAEMPIEAPAETLVADGMLP